MSTFAVISAASRPEARFSKYAWGVLAYNVFVVLWGALVRATGSGAGCGEHWPLCNGEVVPLFPQWHTVIEFTHRATSGLALLSVVALYFWSRRVFGKTQYARRASFFSLIFMINETLVGAMLVLLGLVAGNRSPWRAPVMGVHLVNTLLLLGALALAAWWSTQRTPRYWDAPMLGRAKAALIGLLLVSAAGGIAALGDTLFPVASLKQGMVDDFSRDAPILVQLRMLHPLMAFFVGGWVAMVAMRCQSRYDDPWVQRFSIALQFCVFAQFVLGAVNVLLLTPLWTQLMHLLLTDALWVSLILFTACLLSAREKTPA